MYTFLPYYRKGIYNHQDITANGDGSARLEVELGLNGSSLPTQTLTLAGAANVEGINEAAIIKRFPAADTLEMLAGDLVYLEFYEEDLPWRYTIGQPDLEHNRLSPWLMLVVFKEEEIQENFTSLPMPTIRLLDNALKEDIEQQAREAWAFAHVQINEKEQIEDEGDYIKENPDCCFSRILCPRRLHPSTNYVAFLVPTHAATRAEIPYYHRWTFSTAADADFESMARRLSPLTAEDIALPQIDAREAGSREHLDMPCLFMPAESEVGSYHSKSIKNKLLRIGKRIQNLPPNISLLPFYGRSYVKDTSLETNRNQWLDQLNLDPRYRAIAQIGRQIVRENQEVFMDWAWGQIGDLLEELDKRKKELQFASRVGERFVQKHLGASSGRAKEDVFYYTRPIHANIIVEDEETEEGASILELTRKSKLSKGATDAAFQKVLRKAERQVTKKGIATSVRNFIEEQPKVAEEVEVPSSFKLTNSPPVADRNSQPSILGEQNFEAIKNHQIPILESPKALASEVIDFFEAGSTELSLTYDVANGILEVFNPWRNQVAQLKSEFDVDVEQGAVSPLEDLSPVLADVQFTISVYNYFKKIAPNLVFPKLSQIPADSVVLMNPNLAFVESLMVGINQEMSNEFKWREFPCHLNATYFKQFWDYTDRTVQDQTPIHDIECIRDWTTESQLGEHSTEGSLSNDVVILVRSRLLEKFPNTAVYLVKAEKDIEDTDRRVMADSPSLYPSFRNLLEPDIVMLRFDIDKNTLIHEDGLGWFLVFQERPGELRFGLDQEGGGDENGNPINYEEAPSSVDDLSWGHLQGLEFIKMEVRETGLHDFEYDGAEWGSDAAQMAKLLMQRPVKLGIHASDLIGE